MCKAYLVQSCAKLTTRRCAAVSEKGCCNTRALQVCVIAMRQSSVCGDAHNENLDVMFMLSTITGAYFIIAILETGGGEGCLLRMARKDIAPESKV